MGADNKTELAGGATPPAVPRFRVLVLSGPDAGASATSVDGRMTVGSAPDVMLRLADTTVSRYHIELSVARDGIALRDLESTNGTLLGATAVHDVVLRADCELQVGRTRIKVVLGEERVPLGLTDAVSFGGLLGGSVAMREVYTSLARAAPTTSPVLITGESGTGKELAARAVHDGSLRRDGPFEVVDCGGLPPTLIEAELFGHDRGAFTGATGDRMGAFERADKGTIFLDELGELPLELQPKLLRVLAEGEVRRVGGSRVRKVDVRVVAATNRDLRREVNGGRFRADLYYRLAVIQVRMPSLRDRLEDLPVLVPALLEYVRRERAVDTHVALDPDAWSELARHPWPGNVRELRNWLERFMVLQAIPSFSTDGEDPRSTEVREPTGASSASVEHSITALPFKIAREQFERRYVEALLAETHGNVTEAARRAGIDRVTLFRTMRRYGIKRDE